MKKSLTFFLFFFAFSSRTFSAEEDRVLEEFHAYCFFPKANYSRIEQLASGSKLQSLSPDQMKIVVGQSSPNSTDHRAYFIEKDSITKSSILLIITKPDNCTIHIIKDNIPREKIRNSFIREYKLEVVSRNDVGMQIDEYFVPDSSYKSIREAADKGLITISYPKPNNSARTMSIGYMSAETVIKLFSE